MFSLIKFAVCDYMSQKHAFLSDLNKDILQERQEWREVFDMDALTRKECRKVAPPSGINLHKQPTDTKQVF